MPIPGTMPTHRKFTKTTVYCSVLQPSNYTCR